LSFACLLIFAFSGGIIATLRTCLSEYDESTTKIL
jgi:hypothetical protein